MATRSFTVFQDTPSSDDSTTQPRKPVRSTTGVLASRSSVPNSTPASAAPDAGAIDKENLNPLTGQRSSIILAAKAKAKDERKRKTAASAGVLAPKPHVPPTRSKKLRTAPSTSQGPEREPEPMPRKRTVGSLKSKASNARERTSPSARRVLAPLPEEGSTENPGTNVAQAVINSLCYDLTVSPLADVSDAYDAAKGGSDAVATASKANSRQGSVEPDYFASDRIPKSKASSRQGSVEPELRDYFDPSTFLRSSLSSSTRLGRVEPTAQGRVLTSNDGSPPPGVKSGKTLASKLVEESPKQLSTPERRRLYAAFTFSSPSPSSKRFREASGLGSSSDSTAVGDNDGAAAESPLAKAIVRTALWRSGSPTPDSKGKSLDGEQDSDEPLDLGRLRKNSLAEKKGASETMLKPSNTNNDTKTKSTSPASSSVSGTAKPALASKSNKGKAPSASTKAKFILRS